LSDLKIFSFLPEVVVQHEYVAVKALRGEMEDRGVGVSTVSLILGLIALVLVVFRFYTRFEVIHKPGWDDFFIAVALVGV
jgi:hypothetical protein